MAKGISKRDKRKKHKKQRQYSQTWRLKQKQNLDALIDASSVNSDQFIKANVEEERSCAKVLKAAAKKKRRTCYRDNRKLRDKIASLKIALKGKQKIILRLNDKLKKAKKRSLSPISEIRKSLEETNLSENLKSRLVSSEVLRMQVAHSYKSVKSNQQRNFFKKMTCGAIVKKYKTLMELNKTVAPILKKRRRLIYKNKRMKEKISTLFSYEL